MSLCVWSLLAEAQCCLPCGSLALEEVQSLMFLMTARVYWLGKVDSKIRQGEGKEEKALAY